MEPVCKRREKGGKSKGKGKGDQQLQSLTMLVQQMATSQATLLQVLTKQPIPAAPQNIKPNLLPPPTETKPTMEERICANCQTSHHSQTLARCRNRKCGQALPIKPGQEPPPKVPITKTNKNLTNISNRYGVMEEIEEAPEEKEEGPPDGGQDALMEEEKGQEEARPNPTEEEVKAVKLRLQHYKANPTIFTKEEIKAEEEKLSKMSPPPPEREILQDRVHKDISFIYHTMDETTRLFNKEKTAIGEEQAKLEKQLEEITLKANLQKKKLAGLEATHAADQVRLTKLLQAAQKAAKAPEGTKPPPTPPPPQLPQDLQDISLAIPEIKAALEGKAGLAGPLLSLVLSSVDFASAAQQQQAATTETIPMGKNIQPGTVPVNTLPLESSGAAAAAGSEISPTEARPNKRDAETPAGDTDSDRQAHKSQAI